MATITIQVPILSPYYQFTVKNIVEDNHDNDNNITNFNIVELKISKIDEQKDTNIKLKKTARMGGSVIILILLMLLTFDFVLMSPYSLLSAAIILSYLASQCWFCCCRLYWCCCCFYYLHWSHVIGWCQFIKCFDAEQFSGDIIVNIADIVRFCYAGIGGYSGQHSNGLFVYISFVGVQLFIDVIHLFPEYHFLNDSPLLIVVVAIVFVWQIQ